MTRFPILLPSDQETARRLFRKRSGSPSGRRASTATWVFLQTGTARTSNLRPLGVSIMMRLRRSAESTLILSKPRRFNGLRAAVNVVRSTPSSVATAPCLAVLDGSVTSSAKIARWSVQSGARHHRAPAPSPHVGHEGTDKHPGPHVLSQALAG